MNPLAEALRSCSGPLLAELEGIYKDLHQHPELSMQEVRTAGIAADYLEALGYEVARDIGVTGVVGVLRNGTGATVMLSADMDALPMAENTGLPYASTVRAADEDGAEVGVAHSCGHDLHVTWLMGAARVLAEHRDAWTGTVLVVFQPGEEVGRGASSMVADWDDARFPRPDIILGQHVMVGAGGTVSYRPGVILSAGDSLKIRLFGRGSHGSQPQTSIDPVIMAASTTLRLQTIVSREISPMDNAVLTIGSGPTRHCSTAQRRAGHPPGDGDGGGRRRGARRAAQQRTDHPAQGDLRASGIAGGGDPGDGAAHGMVGDADALVCRVGLPGRASAGVAVFVEPSAGLEKGAAAVNWPRLRPPRPSRACPRRAAAGPAWHRPRPRRP